MLKGRFYLFVCDNCKQEVYTVGFPKGFIYLPTSLIRKQMEHRCAACATDEERKEYYKSRERLKQFEFY